MKKIFTLMTAAWLFVGAQAQVVLNELYTDPGAGKQEFFELYNTNAPTAPLSVDNLTLLTFFDISGQKGFYVMDLPNMTIASRSYFVGSAAIPFNYQGVSNCTASDFSWNSASFVANNGYIRKWVQGVLNLTDGNLYYDQAAVPANFNDFFFRKTGTGASYTVFLYRNGQLINAFVGGSGGSFTISNDIVNMPPLFVDMSSTAPDFTINFSGYGSVPTEGTTQDAGSDNGYIRQFDGACGSWTKSSAQVQHTPRATNGTLIGIGSGSVAIAAAINQGLPSFGSMIHSDIVSAPASYFPIDLQIYTDVGTNAGTLDAADAFLVTHTENVVTDGAFHDLFFPYNANILIAARINAGCFDKILFIPNTIILSVKLISFTGYQDAAGTELNWRVESNEQAERFEVQKSYDGKEFTTVGLILAGEEPGTYNYRFRAATEDRPLLYRLRIFSKNGKVDYSNTLAFRNKTPGNLSIAILNNPVREDQLSLTVTSQGNQSAAMSVINMSGHIVQQSKISLHQGNNQLSISLPAGLANGVYLIDVCDGLHHGSQRFTRQR